jgi:cadmium resistance protein CadD (predicted permease)
MSLADAVAKQDHSVAQRGPTFIGGGLALIGVASGVLLLHVQTLAVAIAERVSGGPWQPDQLTNRSLLFVSAVFLVLGLALFGRGLGMCLSHRGATAHAA